MFGSSFSKFHGGNGTSIKYYNSRHVSCATFADAKLATKYMKLVKENDIKTVRKIIKKGFDVNTVLRFEGEMEKMTALHYAAKEGMVQMLKELLTCECDVNVATAFDIASPLHFACELQDSDVSLTMAEDLINAGADVNLLDHAERSALITASERGNLQLVRLLLESGAEVDHRYEEEEYPSSVYQALKFITFSPPQIDEKIDAYNSNTSLIQACRAHHFPVVKELIKHGANLEVANANGNTPLHIACQSECKDVYATNLPRCPIAGHSAIVKYLIEAGANLNARNLRTDTPLKRTLVGIVSLSHWSYPIEERIDETLKMFDIVQILLHSGCDVRGRYEEVDYSDLTAENPAMYLKTALHYLLCAGKAILCYDSVRLQERWQICIHLFLAAGCNIDSADLQQLQGLSIPTALLDNIRAAVNQPPTLKKLCNISIRQLVRKPLTANVAQLGLPHILNKLVSLEII